MINFSSTPNPSCWQVLEGEDVVVVISDEMQFSGGMQVPPRPSSCTHCG